MSWEEAAHQWLQTFAQQCKTGTHAELRLICEGGHLKVTVCADLGQLTAKTGHFSGCWGEPKEPKDGPSRVRRRERRAAMRAAAENAAAENAAAEKVAAEKVAAEKAAAEKAAAEKAAAEKASFFSFFFIFF